MGAREGRGAGLLGMGITLVAFLILGLFVVLSSPPLSPQAISDDDVGDTMTPTTQAPPQASIAPAADAREHPLRNGDRIDYKVSGKAFLFSVTGTAQGEITNVSEDGFTQITQVRTNLYSTTLSTDLHWGDLTTVSDQFGTLLRTEVIDTVYGKKRVAVYEREMDNGTITTYLGTEFVIPYRIDVRSTFYSVTLTMSDTSVEAVKTMNGPA